jgi:drug/metabolite transporter (DMT)-like permease
MLFGLGAALGFGIADLFGAIGVRRIGVPVTVFVIQLVDVIVLSLLLLTPLPGSLDTDLAAGIAIVATGLLGTVSFFSFYRALQLGPVGVVSPVFASYAAIAVLLSVVLIDERPSPLGAVGLAATIVGVVLATVGTKPEEGRHGRGGIPFAFVAMIAWGVATFLLGRYAQETGWFLPVYGSRLVEFIAIGAVLVALRVLGRMFRLPRLGDAGVVASAAIADVIAVALVARGSEVGQVSIVSAVSATFPLVLIAAGILVFHEHPTAFQLIGSLTTVAGLVALSLGT